MFFKFTLVIILLFLLVILILFPEICSKSFTEGLVLFSSAVLPSLFPFLFITKILTDFGVAHKIANIFNKPFRLLFGINGKACYILLMSIICGYPVGAKILSDLVKEGQISKQEAAYYLPFCSSSGPLFIIGAVGVGMFGNKIIGIKLFIIHMLSVIAVAFVLSNITRIFRTKKQINESKIITNIKLDQILAKNMTDTCYSVLLVGGFISFFYLVIDILTKFNILSPISIILSFMLGFLNENILIASGVSSGLIEMTRGCKELSVIGGISAGVATSGILAFGGLSIILQSVAFLSQAKISSSKFIGIKIMQTVVAVCISLIIL